MLLLGLGNNFCAESKQEEERANQGSYTQDFEDSRWKWFSKVNEHIEPFVYAVEYSKAGNQPYLVCQTELTALLWVDDDDEAKGEKCQSVNKPYEYH